jgi:hypothetical protein
VGQVRQTPSDSAVSALALSTRGVLTISNSGKCSSRLRRFIRCHQNRFAMTSNIHNTTQATTTCDVWVPGYIVTPASGAGNVASNVYFSRRQQASPAFLTLELVTSRMRGEVLSIAGYGSWRTQRNRRSGKCSLRGYSLENIFGSESLTQFGDTTAEITFRQNDIPRSKNFLSESARSFRVFDLSSYQSGNHRISKSPNQGRHGESASS